MNTLRATLLTFPLALGAALVETFCTGSFAAKADSVSLAGQWRFALDREDAGVNGQPFAAIAKLDVLTVVP